MARRHTPPRHRRSISPSPDRRRDRYDDRRVARDSRRDYEQQHRRRSPSYDKYEAPRQPQRPAQGRSREAPVSDDDVREEAKGEYAEYRRLMRRKLVQRNAQPFWHNTPTPSPSPEPEPEPAALENGKAHGSPVRSSEEEANTVGTVGNPVAEPSSKRQKTKHANGHARSSDSSDSEIDAAAAAAGDAVAETDAAPLELQAREGAAEEGAPTEMDLAAGKLFMEWLEAEKEAEAAAEKLRLEEAEANILIGPAPPGGDAHAGGGNYGGALRPGEGAAIAAFVQSGKRIPRRGEVGLTADQISKFEDLGYVMSGSRHNRMNAIRIRKENQVYTAEEKAALAMVNFEENKRKEEKILGDMKALVQRNQDEEDEEEIVPVKQWNAIA
ncbi:hypothetical protein WJX73_010415 [Symbiochloris irregularis]|uniref:NF-kappa-B-activating protein C-terminal domain-containing protein n=1 Tax=Symbiochloris irregularis TaxID=706552 RepID=A0AAW1PZG6_9CHLO